MEIEAKYALPDETAGFAVLDSQTVRRYGVGDVHTIRMESEYYADAAGKLRAAGFTLRLRRENGRGVCCLKQDVAGENAVKIRRELECPAETISDGIRGLLALGAPEDFAETVQDAAPAVSARVQFVRRVLLLERDGACMELAFDAGTFGTARHVPFFELELEWKAGEKGPFQAMLRELEREFALTPQPKSKYARAMQAENPNPRT